MTFLNLMAKVGRVVRVNVNPFPLGEGSCTANMNSFIEFKNESGNLKTTRKLVVSCEPYLGKRTTPQEIVIDSDEPPQKKRAIVSVEYLNVSGGCESINTISSYFMSSKASDDEEFVPPLDHDSDDDYVQKNKKTKTKVKNSKRNKTTRDRFL